MAKKDFDLRFDEIAERFARFDRELPNRVSNMAANDFKDNFRRQGYRADGGGVVRWRKRKRPKGTKDSSRAILVKSGRLRRGIQPMPLPGVARVINRVPYAEVHNSGFKGIVKVKAHKRHSWTKVRMAVKGKSRNVKQRVSVQRVRAHSRKMNMPKRPFILTTKPLLNEIEKYVQRNIDIIFK